MGPLQFTIWKSLFQDIHPGEGAGMGGSWGGMGWGQHQGELGTCWRGIETGTSLVSDADALLRHGDVTSERWGQGCPQEEMRMH